ncbi:MAG: uracil phosphoribosyltransferase [Halobacteriovoraceae bacterium]|nr:uracil phosphoribosyltransferase [Halobacteriovoraceae bacterium]MCB9095117.1 uracil phosphoribosyltransferase [Halobacteriovoraceae bacterium]
MSTQQKNLNPFFKEDYTSSESTHYYPKNIHIFGNNPMMQMVLAKIGKPETYQPSLSHLLEKAYEFLLNCACNSCFKKVDRIEETRMIEHTDKGKVSFQGFEDNSKIVVSNLARAGIIPSHICYEYFNYIFPFKNIRQDHIYIRRVTNEKGQVTGTDMAGSKIGGDVEQAYVIIPDPMGATGGTISRVYDYYEKTIEGTPLKMLSLHLIITPEFIKKVTENCPNLEVFALRLDRGLSDPEVLQQPYGKFWDKERGLNEYQYIVPGAGGVGEVLNNSYV